jgi:UDP-N-acetylmuramyl pentapeptide phosphotransferase/UDP-N-acetylglucosamine-1-phosphate transferase
LFQLAYARSGILRGLQEDPHGHVVGLLATFVAIALLSWIAVGAIRLVAQRFNVVDVPNGRSSHLVPVPLGGGLALVGINVSAWALFGSVNGAISPRHAVALMTGALLISAVSLWDDLGHVPYRIRLAIHGAAAMVFVVGYAPLQIVSLPVVGTFSLGIFGTILTLLWIVGLTNAYNFIDGIDGMVGGQAAAAGAGWIILGLLTRHPLLVALGGLLAASSLGFLVHNWQPARIFMGDAGSTFLGYSLAAITVIAANMDPKLALAGVFLVWPSIFDSGFTVLRRLRRRENIFVGHRTFLFHRLVSAGWTHAGASTLYIPLPIVGALSAVTWDKGTRPLHEFVVLATVAACYALWFLVRHEERRTSAYGVSPEVVTEALFDGVYAAQPEPELMVRRGA